MASLTMSGKGRVIAPSGGEWSFRRLYWPLTMRMDKHTSTLYAQSQARVCLWIREGGFETAMGQSFMIASMEQSDVEGRSTPLTSDQNGTPGPSASHDWNWPSGSRA